MNQNRKIFFTTTKPSWRLEAGTRGMLLLTVLLTGAGALVLVLIIKDLPPAIPLFYSLPWGEIRLASPVWLWVLPTISGLTLIINVALSQFFHEPVLNRILSATTVLVAAMSLISLGKIILLGLP